MLEKRIVKKNKKNKNNQFFFDLLTKLSSIGNSFCFMFNIFCEISCFSSNSLF